MRSPHFSLNINLSLNITSSDKKETCVDSSRILSYKGAKFETFAKKKKKKIHISSKKAGFWRQDKGNIWFILCYQVTTLCLQLDGWYEIKIFGLNHKFVENPEIV